MIVYIEDLQREINILNWYRGEAAKNGGDMTAEIVQSDADQQDALLYCMRSVVTDILLLPNLNRVKFTCEVRDDALCFALSPLRVGREHLLEVLKEAMRLYIVYEVRRLWMMNVRPEWADASMRDVLIKNIKKAVEEVTSMGNRVRRRPTDLCGI